MGKLYNWSKVIWHRITYIHQLSCVFCKVSQIGHGFLNWMMRCSSMYGARSEALLTLWHKGLCLPLKFAAWPNFRTSMRHWLTECSIRGASLCQLRFHFSLPRPPWRLLRYSFGHSTLLDAGAPSPWMESSTTWWRWSSSSTFWSWSLSAIYLTSHGTSCRIVVKMPQLIAVSFLHLMISINPRYWSNEPA